MAEKSLAELVRLFQSGATFQAKWAYESGGLRLVLVQTSAATPAQDGK